MLGGRTSEHPIHIPTLGGDLCHPPPGAEPIGERATRVRRLGSNPAPIRPQGRLEVALAT
jgi:hypothetical protein